MNSGRKSNRRQFLKGRAALEALQNVQLGEASGPFAAVPKGEKSPESQAEFLMEISRRAMACEFQFLCQPAVYSGAVEVANEALDLVDQLEDQMTIYREHSELMRINRSADREPVVVEARLFELLCICRAWNMATGGAFDITAGPLVKLWGFYTRQGRFPQAEEIEQTLQRVGSQHLELDVEQSTIQFTEPGVELNLGSVGKGYALDRCAEVMAMGGVEAFMCHGGQSSILARGVRRAGDDKRDAVPWSVALRHPLRPERRLAELSLCDQALGTSGSGQQFFYHRGRRYGHVLDPRSGVPAEGVLSATVLAPSAAQADALATTFFVLGVEATSAYCEEHPELSVVFVLPGSRQGTVALETVGDVSPLQLEGQ